MADENDATQSIEVTTYSAADEVENKSPSEATTEDSKEPAPEAKADEAPAEGDEPDGDKKDDAPKVPNWATKRINEITRQRYEAERRALALEAELAAYRGGQAQQDPAQQPVPQQPYQPQVDPYALAQEIAARQDFDRTCNTIYEDGAKSFSDFDSALQNFGALGGLPPVLVEAANETGQAAKILYELGKNPEEAMRVMQMNPVRMGMELAKMATKVSNPAPKPISKAPAPIAPVDGASRSPDSLADDLSDAEWIARRNKQLASRGR